MHLSCYKYYISDYYIVSVFAISDKYKSKRTVSEL